MNCITLVLVYVIMNIKILLILNLVFITFVSAETVYKTLDAEGNVIFSDVPSIGAEVIEIEEAQTINIPEEKYRPVTKLKPDKIEYTKLVIASPENDATIYSNEGNVSINVEVEPALLKKDLLVLFMDGKEISSGKSLQFSLVNLERGTHTVDVVVKNEKGKILKRSGKLVFHLRKFSKLFKKPTADTTGTVVTPLGTDNTNSPPSTAIPVP
jgi:hypothetical protein